MPRDASVSRSTLYAPPSEAAQPLNVVLVTPPRVPGWMAALSQLASACDWIVLTVVTVPGMPLGRMQRVRWGLRAFCYLQRVLGKGREGSISPTDVDADGGIAGAVASTVRVRAESVPAHVGELGPDLVLLAGPHQMAVELAAVARLGCWQVGPTLTDPLHAGLSLLGPMIRGEDVSQVALTLEPVEGEALPLADSWGRTRFSSFRLQREMAFRKIAPLLLRALRDVCRGSVARPLQGIATLRLQEQPLGRFAGARAILSVMGAALRSMKARARKPPHWALVLRSDGAALDPTTPTIGPHQILKAEHGWWADPCVVRSDGRTLVFVEEMLDDGRNKGIITCIEVERGRTRRLGTVLEEAGHLSFPQPFNWEGQWYMTVETGYGRRASLYRATDFPLHWTRERDLLTGWECVDPTLFHHEGRWYLFANVAECGNSTWDELFLFVADSLHGEFKPHPMSPVVSDVRHARMAGKLFHRDGRLIRPAQNCGAGYGAAVVFHEVLELGPDTFRERPLSQLAPDWAPALDACHTYSVDGDVELLDVRGWLPTPAGGVKVSGPGTGSTAAFDAPAGPIALRDRPWRWRRARTQQR